MTSVLVAIFFTSRSSGPLVLIDKLKAKHSRPLQIISYKRLSEMQNIFLPLKSFITHFLKKRHLKKNVEDDDKPTFALEASHISD